jgi:hypothetical protein
MCPWGSAREIVDQHAACTLDMRRPNPEGGQEGLGGLDTTQNSSICGRVSARQGRTRSRRGVVVPYPYIMNATPQQKLMVR